MPLTTQTAYRKDIATAYTSKFQHRYFATIAAIIKDMNSCTSYSGEDIANHFADKLARTNSRFNRARFLKACEL